ncbi:MAG TPA: hypothetical protein VMU34_23705 [Mycobacterium sp.]|nr:hypothetical protein [Mycobacterium sp.]
MSIAFDLAEVGYDEGDYDSWLGTLIEASMRLDALQKAVSAVRCLCESGDTCSEQILKVLGAEGV